MEAVLNVIWLLVACGAFAAYAASGRKVRGGALALLCIMALLFPIISATDDMTTDATILEEWSALRRPTFASLLHIAVALAVLVTAIAIAAPAASLIAFTVERPAPLTDGFGRILPLRGPPSPLR
jgi:ABC-type phosphate transport system permease subunit